MQPGGDSTAGEGPSHGHHRWAQIALSWCLPRSDDLVFISLILLPSSFPDAKIRCLYLKE